jgi:hypothetical protein
MFKTNDLLKKPNPFVFSLISAEKSTTFYLIFTGTHTLFTQNAGGDTIFQLPVNSLIKN